MRRSPRGPVPSPYPLELRSANLETDPNAVAGLGSHPRSGARARAGAMEEAVPPMNDVTRILSAIEQGDPRAAERTPAAGLRELRQLAEQRLAQEKPGQTLQATALVHEAYLRLVGRGRVRRWESRGHFFAAAAEAMRRILVENARRKRAEKHGGGSWHARSSTTSTSRPRAPSEDLLALDEALAKLEAEDPVKAQLVKLRYFAGLSEEEAARALGISRANGQRHWRYARAWLLDELRGSRRTGTRILENPIGR